jgi:hypothetical protein
MCDDSDEADIGILIKMGIIKSARVDHAEAS